MDADVIYLKRAKVLLDTSIYINHLNKGYYAELIFNQIRSSVLYLHSIVFEELLAGVISKKEARALYALRKPFEGAGRILTPHHGDWEETGNLMNRLIKGTHDPQKMISMTHDVLLAVSARRLGICVITENRRDFEKIHSLKSFRYQVWSPN